MTINVLPDHVMRTVYFSLLAAIAVFVGMLLLTTLHPLGNSRHTGAVGELVGIDGGVVSGVINLELSGVEASDWRPRHDERYHEA